MTIDHQTRKRVILEHSENHRTNSEIAAQLNIDKETVGKIVTEYIAKNSVVEIRRSRMIEPFLPFIRETLDTTPKTKASALWRLCQEQGYKGQPDHFRALVAEIRPKKQKEAFLRVETIQGAQSQADWGLFGQIMVGEALRKLSLFVMVLSWCRRFWGKFYFDERQYTFQSAHQLAFTYFGGITRIVLYDNLKSVVIKHTKDEVRFNQQFIGYASKVGFEPFATNVRSPTEKGKVERIMRYVRDSFFVGRKFSTIEDLNAQFEKWLIEVADNRKHQVETSLTVMQAWSLEKDALRPLPLSFPDPCELLTVRVSKTCYVLFDTNSYSVPSRFAQQTVTIKVSHDYIAVILNGVEIAKHERSWKRKVHVDNQEHFADLRKQNEGGRSDSTKAWLLQNLVHAQYFLTEAQSSGKNIGSIVSAMAKLAHRYSLQSLDIALCKTMEGGTADIHSVSSYLDCEAEKATLGHLEPMELAARAKEGDYEVAMDSLAHLETIDL